MRIKQGCARGESAVFVDELALMLVNLVAGLAILALYVYLAPKGEQQPRWAVPFAMVGFTGVATALPMLVTWPLPGSYNIAFGDAAMFFGIGFLGGAWALAKGQGLQFPSLWSIFGAIAAIVIGIRLMSLGLTKEPAMAGIAYILSGLGGLLVPLQAFLPGNRALRLLVIAVLVIAALLWAVTAYPAYWSHLASFAKWAPATMAKAANTASGSAA